MAIMPEEWIADNPDSDGSTSSREVQFYTIYIFVFMAKPAGLWIAITGHQTGGKDMGYAIQSIFVATGSLERIFLFTLIFPLLLKDLNNWFSAK